jgi:predicted RNase H-like HicB family nuclease
MVIGGSLTTTSQQPTLIKTERRISQAATWERPQYRRSVHLTCTDIQGEKADGPAHSDDPARRSASFGLKAHRASLEESLAGVQIPATIFYMRVETEQEEDGRWIAEVAQLSGAMAYGATRAEAVAKVEALVLRILADRLDHGEKAPELSQVFTVAA